MIGKTKKMALSQQPLLKYLPATCALVGVLIYPLEIVHFLAVLVHTGYEGIAFVLEEWLTHVLGFSKFQAQMTVFYSSCAIGVGIIYRCIRWLPIWLARANRRCRQGCETLRGRWQSHWQKLPAPQKLQLLLVQFALVFGSLSYMLA